MAFFDDDEEIECTIVKSYGIFSRGIKFWDKEINLISWNGKPAKLDIRNWQRDHKKCGKGIAITREEAEELVKLLNEILKSSPVAYNERSRTSDTSHSGNKANSGKTASSRKTQPSGKSRARKKSQTIGKTETSKKQLKEAMQVPLNLEPFYKELKLFFGAGPEECKTARNTLLKKYHPDMYDGQRTAGSIDFATRKTIKIKEAYEKIMGWWKDKQ